MNELFDKLMDQLEMPVEIRNNPVFKGNIEKVEVHAVSKIWHFYLALPAIYRLAYIRNLSIG